jgi:hypothetical protein
MLLVSHLAQSLLPLSWGVYFPASTRSLTLNKTLLLLCKKDKIALLKLHSLIFVRFSDLIGKLQPYKVLLEHTQAHLFTYHL